MLSQRKADQRKYYDYRIDYAFHVLVSLHCFFFGISGVEVAKTVPKQDIRGRIWLIGWLCERAFRSRLTLRKEGQVELLGASCRLYFQRRRQAVQPTRNSCAAVKQSTSPRSRVLPLRFHDRNQFLKGGHNETFFVTTWIQACPLKSRADT